MATAARIYSLADEFDRLIVVPRGDLHNGAVTRAGFHGSSDGMDDPDGTDRIDWVRDWQDIDDRREDARAPVSRGPLLTIRHGDIPRAVEALRGLSPVSGRPEALGVLDAALGVLGAAGIQVKILVDRERFGRGFARRAVKV